MARIDVLPSVEIIRGLKGILDFYVWRGLPCVRAWPKYRPAKQTAASLAAALTFGAIVKAYSLLANLALQAYREDALDQPRTARDIMVTGVYGNLHEASMSDFLDALIIIRDAVVSLTDLTHALDSIDTDEIVVNVDQSVLPPLAATTTNQATQITALQKLDDLQDALESKALDRLLVRGMDQLFSIQGVLALGATAALAGAPPFIDSPVVTAGQYWAVTTIKIVDRTRAITGYDLGTLHDAVNRWFAGETKAIPAGQRSYWSGFVLLDPSDLIRFYPIGGIIGDTCNVTLHGYRLTLET